MPAFYTLDASWQPRFPAGAHTFSGVAVGKHNSDELFVTQRGNTSLDPVLVLDRHHGALLRSWGSDSVFIRDGKLTWRVEPNRTCARGEHMGRVCG